MSNRQIPAAYLEYLKSPEWAKKRKSALLRAEGRCQLCNAHHEHTELHVHHRTYTRLGHEHKADLVVLCATCHHLFHLKGAYPGSRQWESDLVREFGGWAYYLRGNCEKLFVDLWDFCMHDTHWYEIATEKLQDISTLDSHRMELAQQFIKRQTG